MVKCPAQSLSLGSPSQEEQTRTSSMTSSPHARLSQRGAQLQALEARAGRLRRSPRRRHTKSQNGCPKEARTAQLVRVGGKSFCGKRVRGLSKSCGLDQSPRSRTGRFLLSCQGSSFRLRGIPAPPPTGNPAAAAVPYTDPSEVPAVRPAPPPSAPAPSRTEPTRAGCSAGSLG